VTGSLIAGTDSTTARTPRSQQFQVTAPPSGSQTGTMSWTGATDCVLGATTTSGVDQTTPFNNGTFASGTATPSSVAITSTNGDLTHDTMSDDSGSAPTSPTQTSLWARGVVGGVSGAGSRGPGTGTTTHQWTMSGQTAWTASGANWNQAAGAVSTKLGDTICVMP
jgi:hypothetical protein